MICRYAIYLCLCFLLLIALPSSASEVLLTIPAPPEAFANYEVFGKTIANVGDHNGDGLADFVVGMPSQMQWNSNVGHAYLFYGGPVLDAVADLVIASPYWDSKFGWSVTGLGDFNADGQPGSLEELPRSLVMTSAIADGGFGAAAISAGDLDNNGVDEMIVGSSNQLGYVWVVDELFFDCNDDGIADLDQAAPDCDANGIPNDCQLWLWPEEYCLGDGVVDACMIAADPAADCDGDQILDACTILADRHLDLNSDGILDYCSNPGTLSLCADSTFVGHNLTSSESGLAGPFYLVLNTAPSETVTHVELSLAWTANILGLPAPLAWKSWISPDAWCAGWTSGPKRRVPASSCGVVVMGRDGPSLRGSILPA